jgi:RNA polymerase sigma factor (sigma-70 family)
MTNKDLQSKIAGCLKGDQLCQKWIYHQFYDYSMKVANRYARNEEEAAEMANDAFVRIFTKIHLYNNTLSFIGWLHRIVVNCSISYLRKYDATYQTENIETEQVHEINDNIFNKLSADEILSMVQQLPSSYRIAFNIHIIEGYQHNEIAEMMGITEGTSKSNLFVARRKLKEMIEKSNNYPVTIKK